MEGIGDVTKVAGKNIPNFGGAIAHIIYEILRRTNNLKSYFTAEFIVNEYKKLQDEECIKKIKKEFKKHGTLSTLQDKNKLRRWLYIHTYRKNRLYFEKSGNKYRFKEEWIKKLEDERKFKNIHKYC